MSAKMDFGNLSAALEREAKKAAMKRTYQVECTHCHAKILAPPGKSKCPMCGLEIELTLDFNG